MTTCSTCKYWKATDRCPDPLYDSPELCLLKECTMPGFLPDCTHRDNDDYLRALKQDCIGHPAFVNDGEDYIATLLTLAHFGCNQHCAVDISDTKP